MNDIQTHHNFLATQTITTDQVVQTAPSTFAIGAAARMSPRYSFVPTGDIITALQETGWSLVSARQARVHDESRSGFQLHELRLRRAEQLRKLDPYQAELRVINAHDGSSAYTLHAGIFRRVCSNGMVVSDGAFQAIRFAHRGLSPEAVTKASLEVCAAIPNLMGRIEGFRTISLSETTRLEFARRALLLRYAEGKAPVGPLVTLRTRRSEDVGVDLWSTLNVIQENLTAGGISDGHRTEAGRRRAVRRLSGIRASVDFNKALWGLAEEISITA